MKAMLLSGVCLATGMFASASAMAATTPSAKQALQEQLAPISTLQARFEQQVVGADGEVIQTLEGELAMARPNKFYWQSEAPDELTLVADGVAVYYFDAFVEQVTISDQHSAAGQSPFLLLLDAEATAWADYEVSQDGQSYTLAPTANAAQQQQLTLTFGAEQGQLESVVLTDGQGQQTQIQLAEVAMNLALPYTTFSYQIPADAMVDDQRAEPQL
ncbi:outer membrane lipoprotein chaperone LolA [Pseudidiomarina sediminum]|nr:outer membrane lipoprotein chaperone LolA [Pseudidiomarina sediminum]MBY6063035.1 outer membrane lipoprotein chaperone LolA [Pseudidiomarina sediminum]